MTGFEHTVKRKYELSFLVCGLLKCIWMGEGSSERVEWVIPRLTENTVLLMRDKQVTALPILFNVCNFKAEKYQFPSNE
jgi:hypothetical protein